MAPWGARLLALALGVAGTLAGCSTLGPDCSGPTTDVATEPGWRQFGEYREWTTASGCLVRIDVISDGQGAGHCGFGDARVIVTGMPVGARFTDDTNDAVYVRDPDNVFGDDAVAQALDLDAELPQGAIDTGFRQGRDQLWVDLDDRTAIYLVTGDGVERWPLDPQPAGCT